MKSLLNIVCWALLWSSALWRCELAHAETTITESDYEGRSHFVIATENATYFLDKESGGLSRLLDLEGHDWIEFHNDPLSQFPASAAAGYRGIPNLIFGADKPDAGAGHPGFNRCTSTRIGESTIEVVTKSGDWKWIWNFDDEFATFSLIVAPESAKYWFLYEGPIGGKWSPKSHFFGTDQGGPRRDTPDINSQLFGTWQWAYFGDDSINRTLLLAQKDQDSLQDTIWYLGSAPEGLQSSDGMVVFGFGRGPQTESLLTGPQQFRLGLVESKLHAEIESVADRWTSEASWTEAPKGPSGQQERAPSVGLRVSDETLFGDMECFRIETPHATYLYGKKGAGLASMLDSQGNDWISYRPDGKALGEYRGLPKSGQPTKLFHCGYGFGQYLTDNPFESEVVVQTPDHIRIHSETKNGDSACDWDFFDTHATVTIARIAEPRYWFLYEGTPGGLLEPEKDHVVRPGNIKTSLAEPWTAQVPWVFFTASESNSSLFLIDHQQEMQPDSYVAWPYSGEGKPDSAGMTVFGFGRAGWQDPSQHSPRLSKLPASFSIGMIPSDDYPAVNERIQNVIHENEANAATPWRGPSPVHGKPWPKHEHYFLRHWFQMGEGLPNPVTNNRFRVNDPYAATHPSFHSRVEPKGNGMMLVPMPLSLRSIDAARLYLELWGGHPHTDDRKVTVNGRTTYDILAPSDEQCTHIYREIPLKLTDLVQGPNALQFSVGGDHTFWGHFIVEEAGIDALLPDSDPLVTSLGMVRTPEVKVVAGDDEQWRISLDIDASNAQAIERVVFYGKYQGFDENGNGQTLDWHGMTKRKEPTGHLGTDSEYPFDCVWDVSMLPAQADVEVRAVIEFKPSPEVLRTESELRERDLRYWKSECLYMQTDAVRNLKISHPPGIAVRTFSMRNESKPFWSRAGRLKSCEFEVDIPRDSIERCELNVCVWDGGAGTIAEYFKLNGHFIPVAKDARHDTISTRYTVPIEWLEEGKNKVELLSDTEHHGIEVLAPGPELAIRYRSTTQDVVSLPENLLEPASREFAAAGAEAGQTDWASLRLEDIRQGFASLPVFGDGPDDVIVQDRVLDGVAVRIYRPGDASTKEENVRLPAIVFFHGGGWVLGDLDTHDALCRRLSKSSQGCVISVNYRLAPEHPYPAPLEDCMAVTQYVMDHDKELSIQPDRVFVAGDSAGGNLAAAVALKFRDEGRDSLAGQVLIYPVLDMNFLTDSYQQFASGFGLTRADMIWFWEQYVGGTAVDAYAAPLRVESTVGLPPTLVITAQCDVLRDEGEAFAKRLQMSGVPVTHRRVDGVIHGFVHFAGAIPTGLAVVDEIAEWIKR